MKTLLALTLALTMVGCAGLQQEQQKIDAQVVAAHMKIQQLVVKFRQVSLADLQAAAILAHNAGDLEAEMCWNGLIPIAQSSGTSNRVPSVPHIMGGATLFQSVRNVLQGRAGQGDTMSIARQVNLSCAPLFISAQRDVAKVATAIAGAVSGNPSGLLGLLPGDIAGIVTEFQKLPIPR